MKKRIIDNFCVSLYISFAALAATSSLWWHTLTSREIFAHWCICLISLFVSLSVLRELVRAGLKRIEENALRRDSYDARGGRRDNRHLGYVSRSAICAAARRQDR